MPRLPVCPFCSENLFRAQRANGSTGQPFYTAPPCQLHSKMLLTYCYFYYYIYSNQINSIEIFKNKSLILDIDDWELGFIKNRCLKLSKISFNDTPHSIWLRTNSKN